LKKNRIRKNKSTQGTQHTPPNILTYTLRKFQKEEKKRGRKTFMRYSQSSYSWFPYLVYHGYFQHAHRAARYLSLLKHMFPAEVKQGE
jgi:hypothetical protein